MGVWLPDTGRITGNGAGSFVHPVEIGLIHTTEGSTIEGAVSAYRANNSWPHFTTDNDRIVQHLPGNVAARSLQNAAGGVETNREGVIQVEVVGFAGKPGWSGLSTGRAANVAQIMRWAEDLGVPIRCGVEFGSSAQYGLKNPLELSQSQWLAYRGWLGHQHAPENRHWDPGAIDIDNLIGLALPDTLEDDMPTVAEIAEGVWKRISPRTDKSMDYHVRQGAVAPQVRNLVYEVQRELVEQREILARIVEKLEAPSA